MLGFDLSIVHSFIGLIKHYSLKVKCFVRSATYEF